MGIGGLRGALLRPNPIGGRNLDGRSLDPLWHLLKELDAALVLNEGTSLDVPQAGLDRYDNFIYQHMIFASLRARHPNLRVVIVEAGGGWVPYWIERMDHHVKEWGHASAPLRLKPSEYRRGSARTFFGLALGSPRNANFPFRVNP